MERRTAAARRTGFTLIELLFVIAIIAVLAALLLVGVNAVRGSAKRYSTVSEINQLQIACDNFKNDFKSYPPTMAPYTPTLNGTPQSLLNGFTIPTVVNSADQSYAFLRRMFPNWIPMTTSGGVQSPAIDGTPISTTVDANGNSYGGVLANAGTTLDANQALVYFLGGPTGLGWHPTKPYPPAGATAKGPYYDFPQSRLKVVNGTLPWFMDTYGSPYCYFVSPTGNRTTAAAANLLQFPSPAYSGTTATVSPNSTSPTYPSGTVTWGWKEADDTSTTGTVVVPFFIAANKPQNPKGVQIISAGPDRRFGPGDLWQDATASGTKDKYSTGATNGVTNPGGDDMGNFNGGSLAQDQ